MRCRRVVVMETSLRKAFGLKLRALKPVELQMLFCLQTFEYCPLSTSLHAFLVRKRFEDMPANTLPLTEKEGLYRRLFRLVAVLPSIDYVLEKQRRFRAKQAQKEREKEQLALQQHEERGQEPQVSPEPARDPVQDVLVDAGREDASLRINKYRKRMATTMSRLELWLERLSMFLEHFDHEDVKTIDEQHAQRTPDGQTSQIRREILTERVRRRTTQAVIPTSDVLGIGFQDQELTRVERIVRKGMVKHRDVRYNCSDYLVGRVNHAWHRQPQMMSLILAASDNPTSIPEPRTLPIYIRANPLKLQNADQRKLGNELDPFVDTLAVQLRQKYGIHSSPPSQWRFIADSSLLDTFMGTQLSKRSANSEEASERRVPTTLAQKTTLRLDVAFDSARVSSVSYLDKFSVHNLQEHKQGMFNVHDELSALLVETALALNVENVADMACGDDDGSTAVILAAHLHAQNLAEQRRPSESSKILQSTSRMVLARDITLAAMDVLMRRVAALQAPNVVTCLARSAQLRQYRDKMALVLARTSRFSTKSAALHEYPEQKTRITDEGMFGWMLRNQAHELKTCSRFAKPGTGYVLLATQSVFFEETFGLVRYAERSLGLKLVGRPIKVPPDEHGHSGYFVALFQRLARRDDKGDDGGSGGAELDFSTWENTHTMPRRTHTMGVIYRLHQKTLASIELICAEDAAVASCVPEACVAFASASVSKRQVVLPSSFTSLHQRSPTIKRPVTFLTVQKSNASSVTVTTNWITKSCTNQPSIKYATTAAILNAT
ncbi:hypothetical protein FVE85_8818 [Porphyridium purpureum]|uniref:Uncharacterized protein n=1 Tax=Porphyridium purpureum TaxID=35688 RepID=A0A5J4YRG0_PORPP|nr:hypothetical protein FVE85_8818 [Porphyridium purpureum]|eukprot:POR5634..scf296_7